MSIPTPCSRRRAPYTLNGALLGKSVHCKICRQSFVVQDPSVAAPAPAAGAWRGPE